MEMKTKTKPDLHFAGFTTPDGQSFISYCLDSSDFTALNLPAGWKFVCKSSSQAEVEDAMPQPCKFKRMPWTVITIDQDGEYHQAPWSLN